jgi:transcriptional regulator with XRE-family HTH domain
MEIGKKLKEARAKFGMTQEQVANTLFVSRQTISNWETGKSYPDIASVIRLSDLYSVSLDELLKGDVKMVEHLEESTDVVKSNKKLIGAVLMCVILFLAMIITVGFMPQNTYVFAGIFCLAVIGTTSLLYQIVKKI